jgi:Glycosyl hydrolases family 28
MNRRSFVRGAGLLAVGSAFCGSLVGCDTKRSTLIPCLGVALPPVPVDGMTYIRASEIGCALDCNLGDGRNKYTGGAATDDGPRINAAMAGATSSNPITLIIDGSALISGLFLPAGGYWSIAGLGCGTGFFIKQGTNNDGIHNGDPRAAVPSDPGPPAPPRGSNVTLTNFTLNGNQGYGHDGDSTTGERQGNTAADLWYYGINLMNLNNITIENVVVVNTPAYHIRLSNVGNITVSGCILRSSGVNTDGLHFDGPANDIAISNCDFVMNDDAIALNCPEGYTGDISRVSVTNCTFKSLTLMRLYTVSEAGGAFFNINTVTVSHCSGVFENSAFLIGTFKYSNPDSITAVTISDCNVTSPAVLDVSVNFGSIALRNVTLTPLDTHQAPGFAFVRTGTIYKGLTYIGSSLSIDNCAITNNADSAVAFLILDSGSVIHNLEFNGFAVGHAAPELLRIVSGSIGQLTLDALDSTHIRAPVSAGGFLRIGTVNGAGVLATGWQFPDAVMANGVPYLSASSDLPSIKVGGVIKPYPIA